MTIQGNRRIFTKQEFQAILSHTRYRAYAEPHRPHRIDPCVRLTMFRLITCCGLRPQEARQITLDDLCLDGPRPHVRVRKEVAKTKSERRAPAWWDATTLEDLRWAKEWRAQHHGRTGGDTILSGRTGEPFTKRRLAWRWCSLVRRLCGCKKSSSNHDAGCHMAALVPYCGRHTFASMALHGGRTLVEVRDAMGHASIATTNTYLHVPVEDGDPELGSLFDFSELAT
tara:strand:+ start:393 stop:1073 length:681 start_codon:yes stop_codon:yes gene_type:complete